MQNQANKTERLIKKNHKNMSVESNIVNSLDKVLIEVNKKEFGPKVRRTQLLEHLLNKISTEDIRNLQESSLTEEARFKRDYKSYCKSKKRITEDEFYGLVRQGKIYQLRASEGEC